MNVELINPFLSATSNVLSTMAQTVPTPGKPTIKKGNMTWGVVTGVIGMAGDDMSGNMVISFDEKSILAIVSKMLMEEFKELNKDVLDAVGELTNMISGGAKKDLSEKGYSFNMATPMMIKGENVEIQQLTTAVVLQVPFTIPEGKFVVEANLAPRTPAKK